MATATAQGGGDVQLGEIRDQAHRAGATCAVATSSATNQSRCSPFMPATPACDAASACPTPQPLHARRTHTRRQRAPLRNSARGKRRFASESP